MVLGNILYVDRSNTETPSISGHATTGTGLAPTTEMVTFDHLETERNSFLQLGYSTEVMDTLLASRRQSAIRTYYTTWKAFV